MTEAVPKTRCKPEPGDLVSVQWNTTTVRPAVFVRKSVGRAVIVRFVDRERLEQSGLTRDEICGKERAIDAWAIIDLVTPSWLKDDSEDYAS